MLSTCRAVRAVLFALCFSAGAGYLPMNNVSAQTTDAAGAGVFGWLDVRPEPDAGNGGSRLTIVGQVFAAADIDGRYILDIHRSGKGGTSNSRQSGAFNLVAGRATPLSTAAIDLQPASRLEITLRLFVGEKEVSTVTANSYPAEGSAGSG